MNSLGYAQKMITLVPKYIVAQNANKIPVIAFPSRRIKIPEPPSTQGNRLFLSWYDSAWNKTKNLVLDNWESAGLIKRRKPDNENRKSGAASNDNVSPPADELAKAKNKAQRHLAENWDAIRQANTETNRSLLDNARESATTTIDELSKSVKETAGNLIDETTEEIKSKIKRKADDVKGKISAEKLVVDKATKEIKSKIKETEDDVDEFYSKMQEKANDLKGKISK